MRFLSRQFWGDVRLVAFVFMMLVITFTLTLFVCLVDAVISLIVLFLPRSVRERWDERWKVVLDPNSDISCPLCKTVLAIGPIVESVHRHPRETQLGTCTYCNKSFKRNGSSVGLGKEWGSWR